ncbi:unnamed protein product [Ranitomeya imitator]|uniref:Helix-turn-helix domain-containing protein n=1 Tax=Ranitomeya imitator TaxID=111125 RepID=A0ABN9M750_9NEOB|nr:unnamed protein product [Ranitomeya imitator]
MKEANPAASQGRSIAQRAQARSHRTLSQDSGSTTFSRRSVDNSFAFPMTHNPEISMLYTQLHSAYSGLNHEKGGVKCKNTQINQQNKKGNKGLEVINLSNHILSSDQLDVLQRGLTFSPTNKFDLFTATKDLYLFLRKLILKKLFEKDGQLSISDDAEREALMALEDLLDEQTSGVVSTFPRDCRPRSTRFPPLSACPAVEIVTKMVLQDFQKIPTKRRKDNLTSKQRLALEQLQKYEDIVIKPADKGGNVVLWPSALYEKEAFKHLRDKETYKKLDHNPTDAFSRELEGILVDAHDRGIIPKQQRGTAMGAACAPSFANLFLGFWEREIFGGGGPLAADHVQCWLRYIDDLFIIWQGPDEALHEFMHQLNENTHNIKLMYQVSKTEVDFLDIKIEVDSDHYLQTDVFRKSTSVNSLLHAESGHPYSTIKAIPVGQHLRMKRICSSTTKFEAQAADLKVRFQSRGYSNRSIRKGYLRAKYAPRDEFLCSGNKGIKATEQQNVVRFISTYNGEWSTMRECLQRHWSILQSDPSLSKCLTDCPSMTARRSKNLKDLLVSSHYTPKVNTYNFGSGGPPHGCFPCGDCVSCQNVCRISTFDSADETVAAATNPGAVCHFALSGPMQHRCGANHTCGVSRDERPQDICTLLHSFKMATKMGRTVDAIISITIMVIYTLEHTLNILQEEGMVPEEEVEAEEDGEWITISLSSELSLHKRVPWDGELQRSRGAHGTRQTVREGAGAKEQMEKDEEEEEIGVQQSGDEEDNDPLSVDGNQGKHRVTKRGPALSYPMFTLVTSEDIAGSVSHTPIQRCQQESSDEIKFWTLFSDQRSPSRGLIVGRCHT